MKLLKIVAQQMAEIVEEMSWQEVAFLGKSR